MSKRNPYSPKFVTKHGEPLPENLRFSGHSSKAIASNGDINASSKKDLMNQIGRLILAAQSGEITRSEVIAQKREIANQRKEVALAAIHDPQTWKAVGEVMAEDIFQTTGREGFARRFLAFKELSQAEFARVRFRIKEVIAYAAASASEVIPIFIRENIQILPEFYISSRLIVEERDIHHSTGDILEEKYQEGLEAIMTAEDRLWKTMADASAGIENTITYFTTFTPAIFSQIRSQVTGWGIPAAYCVLAYDLWNDIIGTTGFSDWFDPVHKHEIVLEGELGTMLGLTIITDAFRIPTLKVLNPGELYIVGTPETHGALQQRGDLASHPIDSYMIGKPERGWYIFEMIAMALINVKSIAAGKRS